MALWSGRFTENVSEFTQRFGASLPVDKALYVQDIAGSKAHAKMLAKVGVISEEDAQQIAAGLDRVKADIESGDFSFDINDEDIHMSVEKALTAEIGDAGARLHTGRSRNDQVATDTRLYAKQRATDLMRANVALRHAHEVVGHLVLLCEQRGCNLDDLSFDDFKAASPLFEEDIVKALDLPSIVAARTTEGGTGEAAVAQQMEKAKAALAEDESLL